MGAGAALRCGNPEPGMSESGQKHALPRCNSNGRFTSISGHKTADSVWRDDTGAQERVNAGQPIHHQSFQNPLNLSGASVV